MTTQPVGAASNNDLLNNYITQQQQAAAAAAAANGNSASSSGASSSVSGLGGNFNTFLKILTTQLQYQDPTSATDTNQFTQELVQFAGVEQQINTNKDLQTLITLQQNSGGLAATLGYIGKYVETPTTSQLPLQNSQAELAYTLPSTAKTVNISVVDANGATVATLAGPTTVGLDRVAWDGKDSNGKVLADGTYTFQLSAKDASGSSITVTDIRTVGLVTALQTAADGTTSLQLSDGMMVNSTKINAVYNAANLPIGTLGDPTASTSDPAANNNTSS